MNLSEPFIKRPVMTTLVVLGILFGGIMAYQKLPVSDLPAVDYPTLIVSASLPGASPETMSSAVATPLERAFMSIEGIETLTSNSSQGSSEIVLQFSLSTDINVAAQDVNAQISATMPLLPANMPKNPSYQKVNPSASPIIYILLTSSTIPLSQLYEYANTFVGERISTIPGVAQVTAYGSPYAARVRIDPDILAARNLDLSAVSQQVSQGNSNQPMGNFDGPERYFLMNADGQLLNAKGYNNLIINYKNNAYLSINNVGNAIDSVKDNKTYTHYIKGEKNQACSLLAIKKQGTANTIDLSKKIQEIIPELKKELPSSMDLTIIFDQAGPIIESVDDVKFTLILAFILVVLVIYVYLGKITDTIIPILVLPTSIVGTFLIMYILGYTIDNLSLLALTLAIGFIIDDAIVVLENIVRLTEEGMSPFQASMEGSKQISTTVFTMTICLSSVFIPLLFLEGMLGRLFHEFAIVIVIAIIFSGIISLTLTPMLCSRFIPKRSAKKEEDEKGVSDKNFSQKINTKLIKGYGFLLKKVLDRPLSSITIGLGFLIGTVFLFQSLPSTLEDDQDIGFIIANTVTSQSSSTENSVAHQIKLNKIINENPSVQDFVSIGGTSNNGGMFFIRLKPPHERKSTYEIIKELSAKMKEVAGVNSFLRSIPLINLSVGQGGSGAYQYIVTGLDPKAVNSNASVLTNKISNLKGFYNVNNNLLISTPQIELKFNREKMSMYGLTPGQVENLLGLAYGGGRVSIIQAPTDQFDVILEVLPQFQKNPYGLKHLWIRGQEGKMIPVADLASISQNLASASINHYNQLPAVTIGFELEKGVALSEASKELKELALSTLPPGLSGKIVGAALQFQATIENLTFLLIMAVLFIYMLLGILYESFILPITVLSALPIAVLGALVTLILFGQILSLYALVGLMLLVGIVQKNGIIMIDCANEIVHEKGASPKDAIYEACLIRFRPIIMTTIAAIMGALPIALGFGAGGNARKPLGLVIVGGLMFSQVITLFLTPVVFIYFDTLQQWIEKKLKPKEKSLSETAPV
jgi:HAE1 family hydrophobic/amphiphilic exporter-1